MTTTMYPTREGYELARPLLMPDATSFADVLEYISEWDHETMTHRSGVAPAGRPMPRYIVADNDGARLVDDLTKLAGLAPAAHGRGGTANEIGPFATIERPASSATYDNPARRAIAIRATDETCAVLADRLVTPDDHLSFSVIVHERDDRPARALILASHGYIIGSHWLAYVDPATIPAYPYGRRDERSRQLYRDLEQNERRPMMTSRECPAHGRRIVTRDGSGLAATIYPDGSLVRTWHDGTVTREP